MNSNFHYADSGIFEELGCFYLRCRGYRGVEKGYHVKITAYHLIYSAYPAKISAYRPLCIFLICFLYIFQ